MRILWLSPWLRPLARIYGEQLRAAGDDVLLITSEQHPQPAEPLDWEIVTDPRPKTLRTWPEFARVYRRARAFKPDVVITELVRDPRWLALGALAPRVHFVHDDQPHGADEERPRWEQALFDNWGRSASRTVCFSEYVADRVRPGRRPGSVAVVPLTSDLPDDVIAAPAAAADRRDFVLVGRLNEYKNLPVVFDAWQRHVDGPGFRGDRLCLFGSAAQTPQLPDSAWWNGGSYDYDAVLEPLRAAKGSIAHYRLATQSGVQVLSMQLGVAPIVSTHGALPEFQPAAPDPIGPDDVAGLHATFDLLADPDRAGDYGASAATHYRDRYAVDVAAASLRSILLQAKDYR
ncbi:glycosyltransferase family 4 protein [Gordonia sp. TBRC 11910]|uniref:Glycosyltransferase family 4 protein n=1 Tax=Gordonia asplenii TaxID=2725283 RepID=A0A848KX52_9ACTN|nr:glycosyltransferase family 4 protein [Gordonia asplenii]NMO02899.1 glycosyltransferase family 4 protein [Gordonia asplenii]